MRKPITIGDLGTIITGKTPPTTNKNYYGDYAVFIKPTDISEQCKFTYETEEMYSKLAAEKYESSLIPKGAICVPCIGTIGTKMTMAPCDCYTNQSINSIVCNDRYDNEYVYYLIKNFLPGLKSYNLGTASGREYVSKSNFEKIELVAEQDKTIQKKIGEFLSRYDSLIENYQKQIKLLEEAAQRLYKEWFVDLHFPGHENTKIVDGVPEGWEKKKVGEITPIKTGKKDANYGTEEGAYPFFTCAQEPIKAPSYSFDTSAVILAGNGDFNVKLYRGRFEAYQRTYVLEPTNEKMLYLLYFCISENMNRLATGASGSTIKFLTKGMIESLVIIEPSINVLNSFNHIIEPIRTQKENFQSQIRLLTEARDRLLPKLMGGEIQV
jgi:type I restriction enzyme S subunit